MQALLARELSHALDGVQVGTHLRSERQPEPRGHLSSPAVVEPGLVTSRAVADHDYSARASCAVPVELVEELGARHSIEHPVLSPVDELPVTLSDGPPVPGRLVGPGVAEDCVPDLQGTHIRHREPCCGSWASSIAQRSNEGSSLSAWSFLCGPP